MTGPRINGLVCARGLRTGQAIFIVSGPKSPDPAAESISPAPTLDQCHGGRRRRSSPQTWPLKRSVAPELKCASSRHFAEEPKVLIPPAWDDARARVSVKCRENSALLRCKAPAI